MRKLLALVLALILTMGIALPAHAVSAQYKSTQAFVSLLDERGITYTIRGIEDDNEIVRISNKDDNGFSYTINLFFDANEENCGIRVWNIITYQDSDFAKILRVCNSLNSKYKYVKIYADESDNTVTAASDLIYRNHDVAEIVLEALFYIVDILEIGYPELAVYDS